MKKRIIAMALSLGMILSMTNVASAESNPNQIKLNNSSSQYDEEGMNKDPKVIKTVQDSLNALGYDCGTADGIAGNKTQSAIKKYQEDFGLQVTGNVTGELIESLKEKIQNKIDSTENGSVGEKDVSKIVSSMKEAATYNSVQVSEPIEQDGAVGYAIMCNNSRFSMISNVRDDGKLAICLVPSEMDSDSDKAFNDYFDLQSYLICAIDNTVDGYDARVYALKAYQDGTYTHNNIEYEFLKDSMAFMVICDNSSSDSNIVESDSDEKRNSISNDTTQKNDLSSEHYDIDISNDKVVEFLNISDAEKINTLAEMVGTSAADFSEKAGITFDNDHLSELNKYGNINYYEFKGMLKNYNVIFSIGVKNETDNIYNINFDFDKNEPPLDRETVLPIMNSLIGKNPYKSECSKYSDLTEDYWMIENCEISMMSYPLDNEIYPGVCYFSFTSK